MHAAARLLGPRCEQDQHGRHDRASSGREVFKWKLEALIGKSRQTQGSHTPQGLVS